VENLESQQLMPCPGVTVGLREVISSPSTKHTHTHTKVVGWGREKLELLSKEDVPVNLSVYLIIVICESAKRSLNE
jgi:hypothetical protein